MIVSLMLYLQRILHTSIVEKMLVILFEYWQISTVIRVLVFSRGMLLSQLCKVRSQWTVQCSSTCSQLSVIAVHSLLSDLCQMSGFPPLLRSTRTLHTAVVVSVWQTWMVNQRLLTWMVSTPVVMAADFMSRLQYSWLTQCTLPFPPIPSTFPLLSPRHSVFFGPPCTDRRQIVCTCELQTWCNLQVKLCDVC